MQKQSKTRSRSSGAARLLTRVYLHAQTAVHAGNLRTWRTTIILITGKPEDPQIEPYAVIKMVQGQVSLVYICDIILILFTFLRGYYIIIPLACFVLYLKIINTL